MKEDDGVASGVSLVIASISGSRSTTHQQIVDEINIDPQDVVYDFQLHI